MANRHGDIDLRLAQHSAPVNTLAWLGLAWLGLAWLGGPEKGRFARAGLVV